MVSPRAAAAADALVARAASRSATCAARSGGSPRSDAQAAIHVTSRVRDHIALRGGSFPGARFVARFAS